MENKFHGQFGEVLVIKDLFDDFDIPKTCIEFGAYDGITNSNTYFFWEKKDFKALLIEPDQELFKVLEKNANKNCTLVNKSITTGKSLNKIIKEYKFKKNIGLLSIDIDSNDLEIFKQIDHSSTFIVIIEFNNQFPVWVDYSDPEGIIAFRHSALSILRFASKAGYQLLDSKGANLILINNKNITLPKNYLKNNLESCFDYREQKRACKDIRIVGSKFTTNAKIFTQKPTTLLRIKRFFMQLILVVNYFLRGKKIPSMKIPIECKQKILDAGLFI